MVKPTVHRQRTTWPRKRPFDPEILLADFRTVWVFGVMGEQKPAVQNSSPPPFSAPGSAPSRSSPDERTSAAAPSRPERIQAVVLDKLVKTYGATPALRGVSATLDSGSTTLLTGPNGAGKSTLLAIVGTQLRPTRGRVAYKNGQDAEITLGWVRAQLGWVSHESHCYGQLTGRQNIELAAELHGLPKQRYEEVAERLALGSFADRNVQNLSRGQRQRVALGRALVCSPSLLLLDEPWTGLDKKSAALLEQIVREEERKGAIVLVVSHAEGLAERLGARELRMKRGRWA